jgi:transposase-like protein
MRRSRLSDEQIIAMLKEQEAGRSTADVCRKHGGSSATLYKGRARSAGLEISDEPARVRQGRPCRPPPPAPPSTAALPFARRPLNRRFPSPRPVIGYR